MEINAHLQFSRRDLPQIKYLVQANNLIFKGIVNDLHDEHYAKAIQTHLHTCVNRLVLSKHSRQATIRFYNDSCLVTIQFQIVNGKVVTTAFFRSLDLTNCLERDHALIRVLADYVAMMTNCQIGTITFFVGNLH